MNKFIKLGARNSAADMEKIQAIHDHAHALGAMHKEEPPADNEQAPEGKAMKFMSDMGVMGGMDAEQLEAQAYAIAEGYDIADACMVMQGLASLAQGELSEGEADDAKIVFAAMRALLQFIGSELDEMEGAQNGETENKSRKAISKREDVNPKRGEAEYGDVKFADEKNKKYPIDTAEHIRAAWNYISKPENAGKYDAQEVATIKRNIIAAWKEKIDKAGPPSAEQGKSKILIPNYIKSLHLPIAEEKFNDLLAVKFVGKNEIKGYAALWGDPQRVDLDTEFFTKQTDFWDKVLGFPRPLTWNHAQDKNIFKGSQVIGEIAEFGDDDVGRWYTAVLDRSHQYKQAVAELINQKALGTSSDSAPQYVERERQKNGSVWLKTWALFAAALTDVPCEPRMLDIGSPHWKTIGVDMRLLQSKIAEAGLDAPREMEMRERELDLLKLQSAM